MVVPLVAALPMDPETDRRACRPAGPAAEQGRARVGRVVGATSVILAALLWPSHAGSERRRPFDIRIPGSPSEWMGY